MTIHKLNRTLPVMFIFVSLTLLIGCEGAKKSTGDVENGVEMEIKKSLDALERHFNREDRLDIIRMTHHDFSGMGGDRSQLRDDLRSVFDSYQNMKLSFLSKTVNESDQTVNVEVSWDLQWVCQDPFSRDLDGDGTAECATVNESVTRRGSTNFIFKRDDGEWKLIQQRNDRLLGSRVPGEETGRST